MHAPLPSRFRVSIPWKGFLTSKSPNIVLVLWYHMMCLLQGQYLPPLQNPVHPIVKNGNPENAIYIYLLPFHEPLSIPFVYAIFLFFSESKYLVAISKYIFIRRYLLYYLCIIYTKGISKRTGLTCLLSRPIS